MKPEAGQLTVNDLMAIGKAASFLRFEAAFKTHATDEARKEWRSVADALTDIECRMHPQTAEDPDEWVIQDRVQVRVGVDEIHWSDWDVTAVLEVRCRRRDLPNVEPEQCAACDAPAEPGTVGCKDCNEYATAICSPEPEQWPKYYETFPSDLFAFIERVSESQWRCVRLDGTKEPLGGCLVTPNRKEITKAEAMALLKKPEPQPQKTRVRLWKNAYGSVMSNPDCEHLGGWQEIHHDSEGFYVEG